MQIQIRSYTPIDEIPYSNFLLKNPRNLLYASIGYKNLLEKLLHCSSNYLLALNDGLIIGAFPLMVTGSTYKKAIVNSLPFYGSNGGIIIEESLEKDEKNNVRKMLLDAATNFCDSVKCNASTFITNPLDEEQNNWFAKNIQYSHIDKRIGQITQLPEYNDDYDKRLLSIFDNPRPRNIRKAINSSITTYSSESSEDMEFLYTIHKENIESIGGLAKRKEFFKLVVQHCNYKLYIAKKGDIKIAALLLLYFNKTVEYFTPATIGEYRNYQPSSLLIFEAMKDAAKEGYKYWNWGGTWLSQEGVYNFKKKWGAADHPYYYYTKVMDQDILNMSEVSLLADYPNWFVIPFKHLKENRNE